MEDLRLRIETLEVLREQAQSSLILFLSACYRWKASILVDDQEVFILIEDIDLLMGKRLRQWRRVNVHRITNLQRSIKLCRRLQTNGDEAIV